MAARQMQVCRSIYDGKEGLPTEVHCIKMINYPFYLEELEDGQLVASSRNLKEAGCTIAWRCLEFKLAECYQVPRLRTMLRGPCATFNFPLASAPSCSSSWRSHLIPSQLPFLSQAQINPQSSHRGVVALVSTL